MLSPLLVLTTAATSPVDAQTCTAMQQNTLTNAGCPLSCRTSPCVLYAQSKPPCTTPSDTAGPCLGVANFTMSGSTSGCNVTYQCLEVIISGQQWLLAVDAIANAKTVSMAYVTEIKAIKYDVSKTVSVYVKLLLCGSNNERITIITDRSLTQGKWRAEQR